MIGPMVELRRSNDLVYLSWARAVLKDGGVETILLDDHVSNVEGSIGAIPRRLMVADDDAPRARDILSRAEADIASGSAGGARDDA